MKLAANDVPVRMAHLTTLMQEADAEWDTLTRAIQTDEEPRVVLECQLKHSLLALRSERPSGRASDLRAQVEALEQHVSQMERNLILENARRDAVLRRFEQTRLALASLRRSKTISAMSFRARLYHGLKRMLHWLWLALQDSGLWYMVVPPDQF